MNIATDIDDLFCILLLWENSLFLHFWNLSQIVWQVIKPSLICFSF